MRLVWIRRVAYPSFSQRDRRSQRRALHLGGVRCGRRPPGSVTRRPLPSIPWQTQGCSRRARTAQLKLASDLPTARLDRPTSLAVGTAHDVCIVEVCAGACVVGNHLHPLGERGKRVTWLSATDSVLLV